MNIKGDQQVWFMSFFKKKTGLGASVNKQQAQELHKPVTKKIKTKKFHARLKDNFWAADFSELILLTF